MFLLKKGTACCLKNQNSSLKLFTMGNILANPGPMGIPSLLNMIISKYFVYLKGRIKITGYPPNQSASTRPCSDLRRSIVAKQPYSKELVVSNSNSRCCLWTGRPIFIPTKKRNIDKTKQMEWIGKNGNMIEKFIYRIFHMFIYSLQRIEE